MYIPNYISPTKCPQSSILLKLNICITIKRQYFLNPYVFHIFWLNGRHPTNRNDHPISAFVSFKIPSAKFIGS